jgi:hypothetical protein
MTQALHIIIDAERLGRLGRRIWACMQIFSVGCWLAVYLTATEPAFGPRWLSTISGVAMFLIVARNVWRGARSQEQSA